MKKDHRTAKERKQLNRQRQRRETVTVNLTQAPVAWNLLRAYFGWPLTGEIINDAQLQEVGQTDPATIPDPILRTFVEVICRHARRYGVL